LITYLYFDNFRSLKDVHLPVQQMEFFCGPNGSGKTNIAEAVDFLSKAYASGLPYAVAEKGGFFNMCFRKERRSRGGITFVVEGTGEMHFTPEQHEVLYSPGRFSYRFEFSLRTKGESIRSDFFVATESYYFEFNIGTPAFATLSIRREDSKYSIEASKSLKDHPTFFFLQQDPSVFGKLFQPQERELLYNRFITGVLGYPQLSDPQRMRVYRLSPRHASAAGAPSVSGELGKYGENLPSALDYLATQDPSAFDRLQRWIRDVIPDLDYLKTDYTQTRQMGLFVQEKGFGSQWYAEELSDGTLMSIALFLAVLDRRNRLVLIEEPENSLHPWILQSFLQCCEEESGNKQVLISTQSPVVIAHAKPENLFLVERHDGRTSVISAIEREPKINQIINHQLLDLGEYWLSGGLKAVPIAPQAGQNELFTDKDEELNS
jgi:predicted ATPase